MTCPACRNDVPAGAKFCPSCAARVETPSAEAGADPLRAALEASLGFQYRIARLLGRGGMGAVYLAHELALDRDVAIKVLPPDRVDAADALERFRREARTAARLSHPNIVPLHTFGEVKGLVYFVMGFVRGESLAARTRRGRLGVEATRRILVEVADALAYAHAQGVVHRDIKPDNILIDAETERPMLTDFGVAKGRNMGATLTATGLVVGTPHYMSPEQAAGRSDLDGRSDLYSLGVMAYAMLAGRLPFEGKTPGDVLVQHMTREPPALRTTAPSVPEPLAAAVMRCLAKDPAQRWPDAKRFKEALLPDESAPELPVRLRTLGLCVQGLLGVLLIRAYGWLSQACNPDPLSGAGFVEDPAETATFIAAAMGLYTAIQARRQLVLPWVEIFRAALLQPVWWPGWYPRPLRRPGDLWPRLPRAVRTARQLVAAMIATWALFGAPLSVALGAISSHHERTGSLTAVGAFVDAWGFDLALPSFLVFLAGLVGMVFSVFWLKRSLPGEFDVDEMPLLPLLSATWKKTSPWRKPAYLSLLKPLEASAAESPRSEAELERDIRRLADALPAALEGVASPIRAAAGAARSSIAALDEEIATLAHDVDPAEAARLSEKLSALGPAAPAEAAARREMRDLLAKQLALFQGLSSRLQSARRDRERRVEQLRALWLRLTSLSDAARDAATNVRAAGELRALCAEIENGAGSVATIETPRGAIADLPTIGRE